MTVIMGEALLVCYYIVCLLLKLYKQVEKLCWDILRGVYGSDGKNLGDFGFTVDASKKKKK